MHYDYYLYYLSYFSSLYNGYPLVVRITAVMVMLLLIIVFFGLARLFFIGYKINKREKRIKETRDHFEDKLTFVMRSKSNYDLDEVRELLHVDDKKMKKWKSDLLTDIVLSVRDTANKDGELNEINYKNCIEALRLMGFWEKRIRTAGLGKRREALQIVGQIDNGVNTGILSKSTFHKNKNLRKTARYVHTSQDDYDPFRFMEENFDETFTQLDKLRLHSTLVRRSRERVLPNLLRWINNSKNPNYIIFILREISFFKQTEAAPTLVSMLDKENNRDIRAQIVHTLGDLGYQPCIAVLQERFPLENVVVREAIINALGKLKEPESLKFLLLTYETSDDASIKLATARAMKNYEKEGNQTLRYLQQVAKDKEKEREEILLEQVLSEGKMLPV